MTKTLAFFLLLLLPVQAVAAEGLDVQAQMRRPGVKLVAVEFFATWCKPCMAAVPKWKALHERYRDKGLRFVVVVVGEEGACSSPGWNPDQTICDLDGRIQQALGANPLPQAFLWSWQGNLLASHADAWTVEKVISRYFQETPRILLADPTGQNGGKLRNGNAIRELVRTELRKQAKFDLVADGRDLEALRTLRKQGSDPAYAKAGQCRLGAEVSANSELKIRLLEVGKGKRTMLLQLYSVEQGCMLASSQARVGANGLDVAIFEAVTSLVDQLIGRPAQEQKKAAAVITVPGAAAASPKTAPFTVKKPVAAGPKKKESVGDGVEPKNSVAIKVLFSPVSDMNMYATSDSTGSGYARDANMAKALGYGFEVQRQLGGRPALYVFAGVETESVQVVTYSGPILVADDQAKLIRGGGGVQLKVLESEASNTANRFFLRLSGGYAHYANDDYNEGDDSNFRGLYVGAGAGAEHLVNHRLGFFLDTAFFYHDFFANLPRHSSAGDETGSFTMDSSDLRTWEISAGVRGYF